MFEKIVKLAEGVEGLFIKNERFNTTRISCNFYLPLKKETVAPMALLPFILTSCSEKYPDFSKLNYKLNKLYGAKLDASAEKYGDFQLLKIIVSVIDDKFAIDGESLVKEATKLILRLIFEPSVVDGSFKESDMEREKRKAIEHIKGLYSEKRIYAKNRLIEEMYKGENYGLQKCGTIQQVEALTGEDLYNAWQTMLKSAFIRFNVVGKSQPQGLFEGIAEKFSTLERENITDCKTTTPTIAVQTPKTVIERDDVTQGKLVMGFSSEMYGNDDDTLPLMVACDIFGGGPYSRLFSNVREKMSLCYYCSASCKRIKGAVFVDSGVETANADRAEKEILNQLNVVKNGEFTDFEFESSIKSICDSLNGYNDSQPAIDLWYSQKVNSDKLYTPNQIAERIKAITKQEVINAAKGIRLNTVYKLLPKE